MHVTLTLARMEQPATTSTPPTTAHVHQAMMEWTVRLVSTITFIWLLFQRVGLS